MKQLSDLQRTTLAHMGITQWRATGVSELEQPIPSSETKADTKISEHGANQVSEAPKRELIDALLIKFSKGIGFR